MNKPKLVILSCVSGGGHQLVAMSLVNMLSEKFAVEIVNAYTEILNSNDEKLYNSILKYNLSFLYWPICVKLFRLKLWLLQKIYIKKFKKYFIQHKFDAVISVIPFFNNIIAKALDIPFIILPVDSWNPLPNYWFAPCDLIFTYTEKLYTQCHAFGLKHIVKIPNLPMGNEYYQSQVTEQNPTSSKRLLIIFGKYPPTNLYYLIYELSQMNLYPITVICGANEILFNKLQTLKKIKTFKFIDSLKEIIDNNDIVITKPGSGTVFSVLARGKYLLLENNYKTMLQEKYNVEYVEQLGVGRGFSSVYELKKMIGEYSNYKNKLNKILANSPKNIINKAIQDLLLN